MCVVLSAKEKAWMCQEVGLSSLIGELNEDPINYCQDCVLKDGILYRKFKNKLLFVMLKSIHKSLVVVAHDLSGYIAIERPI